MNEQQARVFVRQIIEVIKTGTSLTAISIDDQIAEMALKAVDNDVLWAWIYKIISGLLNNEPDVVGCEMPVTAVEAIDPATIIMIVQAIVALWKAFRK